MTLAEIAYDCEPEDEAEAAQEESDEAEVVSLNLHYELCWLKNLPQGTVSTNAILNAGLKALQIVKLGANAILDALPELAAALRAAPAIVEYVLALLTKSNCDQELLTRRLEELMPEENETMLTVGEQLKEIGRREEAAKARAEMLLRQLRKRFTTVPTAVEERIRHAEPAVLDAWAEQLLDARTIEEAVA